MDNHHRTDRAHLRGLCSLSKGSSDLLVKRSRGCAIRIRSAWRRRTASLHTHSADDAWRSDAHTDCADARVNSCRELDDGVFINRHLHIIADCADTSVNSCRQVAAGDFITDRRLHTITYRNAIAHSGAQAHSDAAPGHFGRNAHQSICQ